MTCQRGCEVSISLPKAWASAIGAKTADAGETQRILGLDIQLFGALVAAVGLLFLWSQVAEGRKQRRLLEIQIRRELADMWRELADCWNMAVLAVRGTGNYYSPVGTRSAELMKAYEVAAAVVSAEDRQLRDWQLRRLAAHGDDVAIEHVGPQPSFDPANSDTARAAAIPIESEIRRLLQLLDDLVRRVIQGGLDADALYSVVGADLVRSTGVLRELVGRRYAADQVQPSPDDVWPTGDAGDLPHPLAAWLSHYPGLRIRLLVLCDLLWASACRRGDLWFLESAQVAELKRRTGAGWRNRVRFVRVSRSVSRGLRATSHRWRLLWLLTEAEAPRLPVGPDDSSAMELSMPFRDGADKGFRRYRRRVVLFCSTFWGGPQRSTPVRTR